MLGLLMYGYATGVYSSRRIEAATHDSIAFGIKRGDDPIVGVTSAREPG